jgi:hypothetical protein
MDYNGKHGVNLKCHLLTCRLLGGDKGLTKVNSGFVHSLVDRLQGKAQSMFCLSIVSFIA